MVRYPITAPQSQERPQRKRVRAAPLQTALAVDALEVAHQVHPEIAPGRHRGRAHPGRVIRPAARLGKGVEAALDQHRLQAVIKHMTRRARHLRPAHHQVPLTIPSAVPSPSANPPANQGTRESDGADLINGLLSRVVGPGESDGGVVFFLRRFTFRQPDRRVCRFHARPDAAPAAAGFRRATP